MQNFLNEGTIFSTGNGRVIIGFGKRQWDNQPANNRLSFFYPDFFLKQPKSWFSHEEFQEYSIEKLLSKLKPLKNAVRWQQLDKMLFSKKFDELQNLFNERKLLKAVPYAFLEATYKMNEGMLAHMLAKALHYVSKHPVHLYGFWQPGMGILGASPELLFEQESDRLATMACAGSCKITAVDQLERPKERKEHLLVVNGIQEALQAFGTVNCGQTFIKHLPHIAHLVTPINLLISKTCSFADLVSALHPTPALGAIPKEAGRGWLEDYQTIIPRGRFGAPAGLLLGKQARCVVSIRNVQWDSNKLKIGAGCGVIAESKKEDEWEELKMKINAIKGILGL